MDTQTMIMSTIIALLALAGIGGGFWHAKKRGLTFGEIINLLFMREGATFLVILLFLMNTFEAVTAATVHKIGGIHGDVMINPVTRFMMHLIMGLTGGFCAVYSTKSVLDFFKSFEKVQLEKKPLAPIFSFFEILLFVPLSFALPYINVYLISVATEETPLFQIAFKQTMFFWKTNAQLGIVTSDPTYMAISKMSTTMAASFTMLFVHFAISFADGLLAMKDRYLFGLDTNETRRKFAGYNNGNQDNKNKDAAKDDKNSDKENKENKGDKKVSSIPHIKTIIEFLNLSSDKTTKFIDKANTIFSEQIGPESESANELLNSLNEFVTQIEDVKNTKEPGEKDRKRKEVREDIKNFFRAPIKSGGFGIDIQ